MKSETEFRKVLKQIADTSGGLLTQRYDGVEIERKILTAQLVLINLMAKNVLRQFQEESDE